MEEEMMYEQKFQQKAQKQTKQKKSKSAEFLMVKDNRSAAEGIENPAFNISTRNLSAYHNSAEKEIRHDRHDGTLAVHQQKLLLQTYDQGRALDKKDDMDFCLKLLKLLEDEEGNLEEGIKETTGPCMGRESTGVHSNILGLRQEVESETIPPYVEQFEENIQDDVIMVGRLSLEQAQDQRQRILNAHIDCQSQEQHLVLLEKLSVKSQEEETKRVMAFVREKAKGTKPQEEFNPEQSDIFQESLHAAFQIAENRLLKALESRRGEVMAIYGDLTEVKHQHSGMQGHCWKVEWSGTPQPVQIELKCLQAVKDKLPKGQFILRISLYSRLGGYPLRWSNAKDHNWTGTTQPVHHDGNFYNVELSFNQSIAVVLPSQNDVQPGMVLVFELFLLHGINTRIERPVGWGAFPICDSQMEILEGKYKCPLLRGHKDSKIDEFRKIEDLISSDIDHWLCNLYFQVIKLPKSLLGQKKYVVELQLPPHFVNLPECSYALGKNETNESTPDNSSGLKEPATINGFRTDGKEKANLNLKESNLNDEVHQNEYGGLRQKSAQDSCGSNIDCEEKFNELTAANDESGMFFQAIHHNRLEFHTKAKCQNPVERNRFPQVPPYLEDLDQYRFSVLSDSSPDKAMETLAMRTLFLGKMFLEEFGISCWCSSEVLLVMLLITLNWFLRLYLHYCSQWIYLQANGVPVNKFNFYPHTVELCYQNSLLHTWEELTIVALGPLTLNVAMLVMAMIRWLCHILFGSFPSFLSRFIMAMGIWTVLDPLAIFIVDGILGRLAYSTDSPIADAAKLYWLFYRVQHSGIPGILITVILYIVMFVSSLAILCFYILRLHNRGRLLDVFYRLHSTEGRFFVPLDLELSNQELNYIIKKAEQWRGINGERRKVAVYDYIWNDEHITHPSCSCALQECNQTSGSEAGCREITTHVSIYIVYLSGLQELYRHFLRLPDGAIVEVFDAISSTNPARSEVNMLMQRQVNNVDNVLKSSASSELRERQRKF
ncbi:uncharacterized protein ofcc1 [Stegostoma tigrinum]|uniref:uncharacterized protein ofcc1 n=1 Tax=Stegostoma tigrinum TaxID=3053191 RepID=UPI0028706714|nr:uncharacterized protein ofcc1 [Stegostoma tigrinum]